MRRNYMQLAQMIGPCRPYLLAKPGPWVAWEQSRQYTVFINGGRAERPGFECLKARLGRPRTDHKTKQKIWRLLEELLMKMRV